MSRRAKRSRARTSTEQSKNSMRTWLIIGAVSIAVIALGVLLFISLRGPSMIQGINVFSRPSRGHDNTVGFVGEELPPVGGTHHDAWQNCGIYDEPVGAGNAVHSMEHGAVWIAYHPDLPQADVASLQNMVRGESYLLLSPYPELKSPVVLSAWGLQLEVDSVDDNRIEEFIDRYQAGPQTPERGAACTNGVGQPLP